MYYLSQRLPKYMIPSRLICIPNFVYLSNGKIDRKFNYLEAYPFSSFKLASECETNTVFKCVLKIIEENIELNSPIEYNQKVESIGMDSIAFVKIIVDIEEKFGFEFEDEMLRIDKFPYISSFVDYVKERVK